MSPGELRQADDPTGVGGVIERLLERGSRQDIIDADIVHRATAPPPRYVALVRAARACRAWFIAEHLDVATHAARCELCSLAGHLVRKALGDLEGGIAYAGVPRLVVEPGPSVHRHVPDEAEAWALVVECEELTKETKEGV